MYKTHEFAGCINYVVLDWLGGIKIIELLAGVYNATYIKFIFVTLKSLYIRYYFNLQLIVH